MDKVNPCVDGNQHFWLPTTGEGMESYSCPSCGQLVYWSESRIGWVKPGTSGGRPIRGNQTPELSSKEKEGK